MLSYIERTPAAVDLGGCSQENHSASQQIENKKSPTPSQKMRPDEALCVRFTADSEQHSQICIHIDPVSVECAGSRGQQVARLIVLVDHKRSRKGVPILPELDVFA